METSTAGIGPRIAIAAITASKTNPRKRFDEAALAELADSIKRHDVLQPILLRPTGGPDTYELVDGERRFRAAKIAGLTHIPATVRTLTDAEVLEMQVVANLQRADLHELEEAEGYEQLLKCTHPNGERYTVDEIAAKVSKSRSYVFARLKLCALCPEARKAFYAGELDASRALLIARIGHHDTQRQALKDVTKGEYNRGAMSYREAHDYILQNYMLKLGEAPFDTKDAGLLAKAGACGPCPKRTGNQADLFGDVKSADVCTDPKCFDDKRQAHYRTALVALEAEGFKVISGEAAKKALPGWEHRRPGGYMHMQFSGGLERFDGSTYVNGRSQKVSALFDRDFKPTKLQHPLTGEIFDVVTQQAITAAAAKHKKASGGSKAKKRASGPREKPLSPDQIFRRRLFATVVKKMPATPGRAELRIAAKELLDGCDEPGLIADAFAPRKDGKPHDYQSGLKALEALAEKMTPADLCRLAAASAVSHDIAYSHGQPKQLLELATACRVDPAAVKKVLAAEKAAGKVSAKAPKAPKVPPVITPFIKPGI